MANIRAIRRRIRSVQNTAKITQAMQMIAASKMRRAQTRVLASRPYAEKIGTVLGHLSGYVGEGEDMHPLLQKRDPKRITLILITPDRGLTGGLTSNLNRRAAQFILEEKRPVNVITIGKKGRDFMVRHGQDVKAVFTDMSDQATVADILPVARMITTDYSTGQTDRVYLIFARFVSTLVQRPVVQQLLPIEPAGVEAGRPVDYIYEPSPEGVLEHLLPRFVETQIYEGLLEAIASEQSARMVAMRNATENAKEMVAGLTLALNKVRQETITRELLDITGGVAALGG